jgi:hypothetical protein
MKAKDILFWNRQLQFWVERTDPFLGRGVEASYKQRKKKKKRVYFRVGREASYNQREKKITEKTLNLAVQTFPRSKKREREREKKNKEKEKKK